MASKNFFDTFIVLLKKLDSKIESLEDHKKSLFFSKTEYYTDATLYPFIFERIISTYLLINSSIKIKPYIYKDNFVGLKKLKSLEKKFFLGDTRVMFDDWEKNQQDISKIKSGYDLLQKIIKPPKDIFKNRHLNRIRRSILERIRWKHNEKINHFITQLNKI